LIIFEGLWGLWVYGFMGSWVHGFMGSWVHGFMGSNIIEERKYFRCDGTRFFQMIALIEGTCGRCATRNWSWLFFVDT